MVTKEMIKELREKSGAGLVDCKKALQETNGNIEESVKILREKGLATAAKRSERTASQGSIQIAVSGAKAAIIELNCETDFVAKTDEFQNTAKTIVQLALDNAIGDVDTLSQTVVPEANNVPVSEWIKQKIGVIGENIILRKAALIQGSDNEMVAQYIHGNGNIGVLARFAVGNVATQNNEAFLTLVNGICMHIAAVNPAYLNRDNVDPAELAKERDIYRKQMLEQGKPENIVDKIVDGKMNKYYEEVCLLEQEYVVLEDKKKVQQVLQDASKEIGDTIELVEFQRFELGA